MRVFDHKFEPDYVVAPGQILESFLEYMDLSRRELAQRCLCPTGLVDRIIDKNVRFDPTLAFQFERVLGVSADILLDFQIRYRFHLAKLAECEEAKQNQAWLEQFPVNHLVSRESMKEFDCLAEKYSHLLEFFRVASVNAWNTKYKSPETIYQHPKSFNNDFYSLIVWKRLGEIAVEERFFDYKDEAYVKGKGFKQNLKKSFSKSRFKKALNELHALTNKPVSEVLLDIEQICENSGVFFVLIDSVPNISVTGATWWDSPKNAVIQLNSKQKMADQFWFNFFHQAGHILLHDKSHVYFDDQRSDNEGIEHEANEWAFNAMISKREWKKFVSMGVFRDTEVTNFAVEQNVAPGIVVDRLQYEKVIKPRQLNNLKVKLDPKIKLVFDPDQRMCGVRFLDYR